MIKVPDNIPVSDWPASVTWLDESGILYAVYKKGVERSLEETTETISSFRSLLNGEKICMLVDVTYSSQSSRAIREYAATELPHFIKAIAMVSDSALGTMLANLFLTLKTQPYPTKVFKTEEKAREWLKQYL